MEAVLSGRIPFLEGGGVFFGGQQSETTRKIPFEFVKAHYEEILKKRPSGGGFDFGSELPFVGRSYCDVDSKAQLKSFFEPRVKALAGASHALSEVLENIDVCIAAKSKQQAAVEAFLRVY